MSFITRLFCLVLLLFMPLAHAWERPEMAAYGATYRGPEQLEIYVAHTKADNYAVVKIYGINHPLDGHVFWTKVNYSKSNHTQGFPDRISYTDESVKAENLRTVLFIDNSSGVLYLPNYRGQERAEIPVHYSEDFSRQVRPEHILTDYERQIGQIK